MWSKCWRNKAVVYILRFRRAAKRFGDWRPHNGPRIWIWTWRFWEGRRLQQCADIHLAPRTNQAGGFATRSRVKRVVSALPAHAASDSRLWTGPASSGVPAQIAFLIWDFGWQNQSGGPAWVTSKQSQSAVSEQLAVAGWKNTPARIDCKYNSRDNLEYHRSDPKGLQRHLKG